MSRLTFIPAALLALLLVGCGTPSQPLPMAVAPADALQIRGWVPEALKFQVGIAPVQGGMETGRWWGSKVSATALQQALEESLHAVGMKPPAPEPAPRFELQTELLQLEQPTVPAIGVTVGAAVRYTLVDKASGRVVYQRRIANTEEAGLADAIVSPSERLRIANERTLRANISLLLRDLVTLRP
ncbi:MULTISPECIES: hypothetical protein [Roseateles]|uniref:ABC-type transport auxiliary lipoprotein component domain-containing protein n=1 Tax=Pelomonas aquatica TaxID=431058 RepID=A0ABU1ZD54_9BURK|nr:MULTISPECIES: hypothetical protein [Roseateles]KQY86230.1 hypothetical protein ASD35_21700 [Pelomonas sp. Root1444]MDR7298556.1 hypothetical protein [Pelomonas aquatica]